MTAQIVVRAGQKRAEKAAANPHFKQAPTQLSEIAMDTDDSRVLLLKKIIEADGDIDALIREISHYSWDYTGEPVIMKRSDIKNILLRYVHGEFSECHVHEWADFFELRDDIDYPPNDQNVISEIMHELANPEIEGSLTIERARLIVEKL